MPTFKKNTVGAAQCLSCGRFFRTKKDSTCPSCNPSSRTARRLRKKAVRKAIMSAKIHYCQICGFERGSQGECVNDKCPAWIPF